MLKLPGTYVELEEIGVVDCKKISVDSQSKITVVSLVGDHWSYIFYGDDVGLVGDFNGYSKIAEDIAYGLSALGLWSEAEADAFHCQQWSARKELEKKEEIAEAKYILRKHGLSGLVLSADDDELVEDED